MQRKNFYYYVVNSCPYFDLADIAQVISDEVWMSAKVGEMNYNSSH